VSSRDRPDIARARAAADRQLAHVDATIDEVLLPQARRLLSTHDPTDAWAMLSASVLRQVGDRPEFTAEVLSRLVLRLLAAPQEQLP
jgi:hypothetical protein